MNRLESVRFDHLVATTDANGLFEHSLGATPRPEHGYCTDDNARLLVVASRGPGQEPLLGLSRTAMRFTLAAVVADGRCRNRMNAAGEWIDEASTEDCWGRALWGFGTAAARHGDPLLRQAAVVAFTRAAQQRSPWRRAMAFAALGAAEILEIDPSWKPARELLADGRAAIGSPGASPWRWPEPELTYANAALAEVCIAAGELLGDRSALDDGLTMLDWLLTRELRTGHLSVTPVGGSSDLNPGPRFDQQPIEVAAMADACWRAHRVTGEPRWAEGVSAAAAWFDGVNDIGQVMVDRSTGGGYDGLRPDGVNLNQGAESTLAWVATAQRAEALRSAR